MREKISGIIELFAAPAIDCLGSRNVYRAGGSRKFDIVDKDTDEIIGNGQEMIGQNVFNMWAIDKPSTLRNKIFRPDK